MIEKQKYQHLIKNINGFLLGGIVNEFEMLDNEEYLPIPNLELYDDNSGTGNSGIYNNQINYLIEHCNFNLGKEQGWKYFQVRTNFFIALTPDNKIFTYNFFNGIFKENGFSLDCDLQKEIINNYIKNSRLI